jgi:hypothetical protein
MKKTLLLAGALLALTASVSFAGGVNLSWDDCGVSGSASKSNACTNNGAKGSMYTSVVPPVDIPRANGSTSTVDLQTTAAALSPWWEMRAGSGCRPGAMSGSMDFTSGPFNCADPWSGPAGAGTDYVLGFGGPNRARVKVAGAIPGIVNLTADTEWYQTKMTILGTKTAGATGCAGCLDGACFVLNDIFITQPAGSAGGNYHVDNVLNSQHVTWQASGGTVPGGCPGATPTKNATWGSVKSLYR